MFVRDFRRRLGRFLGPLGAFFLVAYFSYHFLSGERGLLAWHALKKQAAVSEAYLETLTKKHDQLEKRVILLRTDVCPSLLEEEARHLGYAHPREVVVYR